MSLSLIILNLILVWYENLKYMFRKWLVEVEVVSWVEILVGNIVHLWKGTKIELYAITVG